MCAMLVHVLCVETCVLLSFSMNSTHAVFNISTDVLYMVV